MDLQSKFLLHTGNQMPVLGLGTWQLTIDTPGTIEEALNIGYRIIDTSGDYGTQPGIGEGIKKSRFDRRDIYIVTKVEEDEDAYEATKKNLKELGIDHVDLMLIHRPPPIGSGEELWLGLIKARQDGFAIDIGVSNYSIGQVDDLIEATGEVPAVNQIEWTPFGWSMEMLEYCLKKKIIIQAYSPLTRAKRLEDEALKSISSRYGKTPAQLLIRWNLQLGTCPLPKANQKTHLEENIKVFDFEISEEDMESLNSLNENYSSLGSALQYV